MARSFNPLDSNGTRVSYIAIKNYQRNTTSYQYNKLPAKYMAYERNLRVKKKMFSLYDMIGIVLRIIIY